MQIKTIAIQSPGDMGHEIGRILIEGGYRVVSALEGRSKRTRSLAKKAGITDVGGLENLFGSVDIILSIMRPDKALDFVINMSNLAHQYTTKPTIVDLNAVAPSTGIAAADVAGTAGLIFIDGGIIGEPPRSPKNISPRLYISGPGSSGLMGLNETGLEFRNLGNKIGSASGIKMAYAALTKGLTAIAINSMVTASIEGIADEFLSELAFSQPNLLKHIQRGLPSMCPKAYRWIGEMEEISKTHKEIGLPGKLFEGAANIYQLVEASPLGKEVVEKRNLGKTANDVAQNLEEFLKVKDTDFR
ncbi:MAG: 6-phosphogluconate dehydrogenase [Rhodospirillaceae bacterium]|nr:6-phosphogluconate dehydrogenase [Rhodospirillaceae bacterium]|tara:strand:- start:2357 stop:3262 length:906 start_codon:yes stop_codon:yes gene_type:complete